MEIDDKVTEAMAKELETLRERLGRANHYLKIRTENLEELKDVHHRNENENRLLQKKLVEEMRMNKANGKLEKNLKVRMQEMEDTGRKHLEMVQKLEAKIQLGTGQLLAVHEEKKLLEQKLNESANSLVLHNKPNTFEHSSSDSAPKKRKGETAKNADDSTSIVMENELVAAVDGENI